MKNYIFAQQMDYLFFFYGASFVVLGAVCFAILRRSGESKTLPWWWLGLFGFFHGLNEWLDMVAISLDFLSEIFVFKVIRLLTLLFSFIFLMEFGRRGHFVIWKKKIRPEFYIGLSIFVLLSAWGSWAGMNAAVRYSFGLMSALWAALILLHYRGSEDKPLERISVVLLRIAGIAMFFYGLTTGLIVTKANFFPASILNTESFIALIHVPVQFFRSVFAFVIAIFIAIFAVKQSIMAFLNVGALRWKHFLIFSIASVVFVLVYFWIGFEAVDHYSRKVEQDERYTNQLRAKMFSQFVNMTITGLRPIQALAANPNINAALQAPVLTEEAIADMNERLDRYRVAMNADVCYLMDRSGLTVASTNRNSPTSFVGKNYAFRPYFQEAIKGKNAVYLAKGVTSMKRGIYVAYPIRELAEGDSVYPISGVAVVKASVDELEEVFRTYPYVFLISPEGIIFVSSRHELVFKSIRDMSAKEKEALRNSRQFGLEAWDNAGFINLDEVAGKVDFKNKTFYFATESMADLPGWRIFFLGGPNNVIMARFVLILIFLSLFLLVVIISLFIFRIYLDKLHIVASEAVYEALVEGSPDSIMLFNRDGCCLSINKTGLEMMGWKKEDVLGKLFEELWPQEYEEKVREVLKGVVQGRQQIFEARRSNQDNTTIVESVTLAPIFEANGGVKYFIVIARDVTEERRSRQRLMQSSKMATVGALATGVSHEFNNVLEIILGNAELAHASDDPDVMKKTLKVIIDSVRRAALIVKRMLDFSGKASEARELVDLTELIRQNLSLLNKVFEADDIVVQTHFKDVPKIYGNPSQLSQAFVNIMMNARDAMQVSSEKRLTITVEPNADASEVVACFEDTGCGIKDEIKHKLFGPFVTTKGILGGGVDQQPGVGLGLYVAYGIIRQHAGNILVESEEGKGARFCISLPVLSGMSVE